MKAKADTSPEAMQKMVTAFEAFGVTKEQIEKRIQRRLDAIQPAQVVSLKKIYASLRDGMSSPADWFELPDTGSPQTPEKPASRTDSVKEKARTQRAPQRPAAKADPQDDALRQVEQGAVEGDLVMTYAEVANKLQKATHEDHLAEAADLIRYVASDVQRDELGALYKARAAAIRGE